MPSLIDNLTSYLGSRNPFSHPADPKKSFVWLLDNTAYHLTASPTSPWQAEFIAAFFIKNSGRDPSAFLAEISSKLKLAKGDKAEATIAKRLAPLLDQIQPAKTLKVTVGGDVLQTHQLGPSDRNGISTNFINITGEHADGSTFESSANVEDFIPCTTRFATQTGWGIISDIDDTIKKTLTNVPSGILYTTFVEDPPQVIEGMPELYAHMHKVLSSPPIWYLSASPYNLYPFLHEFRNKHYPVGPLLLKDASWMNMAGFVTSLSQNTKDYKVNRMATDLQPWWPKRKFVCLGDSTQSDPEAYAEMYRRHPEWIKAIFIRRVKHIVEIPDEFEPGDQEKRRNEPQRFEKAFDSVPRSVWTVFDEPAELYARVDALAKAGL